MRRAVLPLAVLALWPAGSALAAPAPGPPVVAGVRTASLDDAIEGFGIDVSVRIPARLKGVCVLSATLVGADGHLTALGRTSYHVAAAHRRPFVRLVTIPFAATTNDLLENLDTATVRIRSWRAGRAGRTVSRVVVLRTSFSPTPTTVVDHGASAAATTAAAAELELVFGHLAGANRRVLAGTTIELHLIPVAVNLTDLPEWSYLAGQRTFDGRPWEQVRGVGGRRDGDTILFAVGEEETTPTPREPDYPLGFDQAHESGHVVNDFVLTPSERTQAEALYRARLASGQPFLEPDWYTRANEGEYVAQSVAAWFGFPYTGATTSQYTRDWLAQNDPGMSALLGKVFT